MVLMFMLAGSIIDMLRPAITSACRRLVSCSYVKLLSVNSAALALLAMAGYTVFRSLGLILSTVPIADGRAGDGVGAVAAALSAAEAALGTVRRSSGSASACQYQR